MLILKHNEMNVLGSTTNRTFQRHYDSFEKRKQAIEREETIIQALSLKLEELGEIDYKQYEAVIAWLIHSNKTADEIMEIVFDNTEE